MRTHIATGTLLVALAAVALAPAASADLTVDVETNSIDCENPAFSTGPAFRDRVYSNGECDLHVEKEDGISAACADRLVDTGPAFSFRVWSDRDCDLHATV